MIYKREVFLLVDAFGNRWHLIPGLVGRGYGCINIQSRGADQLIHGENFNLCHENILYNGDFAALIQHLEHYHIRGVIGCYEGTAELAGRLAAHFRVPGNDPATVHLRTNKYWMNEAPRQAGVPCARQSEISDNADDLVQWFERSGLNRVVFKPVLGALSLGVHICHSAADIRAAFDAVPREKGLIWNKNQFIVQEFLEGPHFWVNTVSCGGRHFVSYIVADAGHDREGYRTRYAKMVDRRTPLFAELADYTRRMLDAVGLQNGPAHSEVRMTAAGARLVEVNPRIVGVITPSVVEDVCGYSDLSLTINAMLEPDLFAARTAMYEDLRPRRELIFIYMINDHERTVARIPDPRFFEQQDSFHSMLFKYTQGDVMPVTENLDTMPGYAMLMGPVGTDWDAEFRRFRELEQRFYALLEKPC